MIAVAPLEPEDQAEWEILARGYKAFYRTEHPDARYQETWRLLMDGATLHGLGARADGRLVGIAHYLFHAQIWSDDACYLQDLFVDPSARGKGVAAALIDRVAEAAKAAGAAKFYWLTKRDNVRARALYDRVATLSAFVRYDYSL